MNRNVATLLINFTQKLISSSLLIRLLQKNSKLISLFRRIEKLVKRLARTEASVDFLSICSNFKVSPKFARLDNTRHAKWKKSAEAFEEACVQEELRVKVMDATSLKEQINQLFATARDAFSFPCYLASIRVIARIKAKEFQTNQVRHQHKLSRLLSKNFSFEHIDNRSSYNLSFYEKLVLCRGLDFAVPHKSDSNKIRTSFDQAAVQVSQSLDNDVHKKEILVASLKHLCETYCTAHSHHIPRPFREALVSLRNNDHIIVSKPDKGNGVVILDRTTYISLLRQASVDDSSKFRPVSRSEPRRVGRPTKHFHPLLKKENALRALLTATLPTAVAKQLSPQGSRLAHLYGLPKTHKAILSMRPILSATGTYNFKLARWLDCRLKPLVQNRFMVQDTFNFVKILQQLRIAPTDFLASFDVVSLFTNVPLEETIDYLVEKAFKDDWFRKTHNVNLSAQQLRALLVAATRDQLFQFDGNLFEQFDGVAMGSPLGPLMANAFLCKYEAVLESTHSMPKFYRRYVDDTFTIFDSAEESDDFLSTLNSLHPALRFTVEPAHEGVLPFIGINIRNCQGTISTSIHRKETNKGLLLHHHSHCDNRYKKSLLRTMIIRAYRISSSWRLFHDECCTLQKIFSKLQYPVELIQQTIKEVINDEHSTKPRPTDTEPRAPPPRLVLPYKTAKLAHRVRTELRSLSTRLGAELRPVFTSKKVAQLVSKPVPKDPLVSRSCVVYDYKCACDMHYVGFTSRHLHQRLIEHNRPQSSIYKHCSAIDSTCTFNSDNFSIIAKCTSTFECRVREAIEIYFRRPQINDRDEHMCSLLYRCHL